MLLLPELFVHLTIDRPTQRMARDGAKHPKGTGKVRTTNKQVENEVPFTTAEIHHHTQTRIMACPELNSGAS